MPTIVIDAAKGLHQKAATTALPAGTLSGQRSAVITTTAQATTTLTAADSGKLVILTPNASVVVLPTPVAGLHFDFIQNAAYSTAINQIKTATTDGSVFFIGGIIAGDNSSAYIASDNNSNDIIKFGSATVAGDRISLNCDGSNWLVTGGLSKVVSNGISFADS